jgi:hypothetical protein
MYLRSDCVAITAWKKFYANLHTIWISGSHNVSSVEIINRELIEYGAMYVEGPWEMGGPMVIFNRASEATRFILTWS